MGGEGARNKKKIILGLTFELSTSTNKNLEISFDLFFDIVKNIGEK